MILPRHISPLDQERLHRAVTKALLMSHAAVVAARKASDVAEMICSMPELEEALDAAALARELAAKAKSDAMRAARAVGTIEARRLAASAIRLARRSFVATSMAFAARDRAEDAGGSA